MKFKIKEWIGITVTCIFVLLSFFPMLIMIMTSFKSNLQISLGLFKFQTPIFWNNYSKAFHVVLPYTVNSLLIAAFVVVGVIILASLASYAFARYPFPGKEFLYYLVIALMMVPPVLTLIPTFKVAVALELLNTRAVVILPQIATGCIMAVFLLRSFFSTLPEELFESLRIDGAKEITILWHLVIPLSKPILGTIAVINFHHSWNDYIWPLITISKPELKPIATGIMMFTNQYASDYGPMMAAYVIASVPLMVIIGFSMRYFVQGLTGGSIKA